MLLLVDLEHIQINSANQSYIAFYDKISRAFDATEMN